MPTTGYAAVVDELNGQFNVQALEYDAPIGREVLVEVRAAGLCHSDLNVASVARGRTLPLIAGHELAGVVVSTGPDVSLLRTGDHVVGTEVRACGECVRCIADRQTLCLDPGSLERPKGASPRATRGNERVHTLGVSAFAAYSLADERQFVQIPQSVPFPQASLLACGVTTGVGAALNVAQIRAGESVAVFGLGGVGLNIVIGARLAEASVIIAVDVDERKLELARRLGATHTVNSTTTDVLATVAHTVPIGVDHAFDAVGVPAVTRSAIRSSTSGGSTYLIGIPKPGEALELDTMAEMIGKQRVLRGIYMGGTTPTRDIPYYAELYLAGKLPLDEIISERIGIHDINRAYATPALGGARAVITDFS